MPLVNIPPGNHVVRHCKRRHALRDAEGNFAGVFPDFFYLRADENYLSGFYYEYYQGTEEARMECCQEAMPFDVAKREAMVRLDAEAIQLQASRCA
jgi:hypothetical protein